LSLPSQFHYLDNAWHREKPLLAQRVARIALGGAHAEAAHTINSVPADSADHPIAKAIYHLDPLTSM
jgi:hypothetical protein